MGLWGPWGGQGRWDWVVRITDDTACHSRRVRMMQLIRVAEHLGASSRRPRHPFPALMAGEPWPCTCVHGPKKAKPGATAKPPQYCIVWTMRTCGTCNQSITGTSTTTCTATGGIRWSGWWWWWWYGQCAAQGCLAIQVRACMN